MCYIPSGPRSVVVVVAEEELVVVVVGNMALVLGAAVVVVLGSVEVVVIVVEVVEVVEMVDSTIRMQMSCCIKGTVNITASKNLLLKLVGKVFVPSQYIALLNIITDITQ